MAAAAAAVSTFSGTDNLQLCQLRQESIKLVLRLSLHDLESLGTFSISHVVGVEVQCTYSCKYVKDLR